MTTFIFFNASTILKYAHFDYFDKKKKRIIGKFHQKLCIHITPNFTGYSFM